MEDNYRDCLLTLAEGLVDELRRDDWEGCTVRELVLAMLVLLEGEG